MIATRAASENDKDFLWNLKVAAMRDYVEKLYGWQDAAQFEQFEKNFRPQLMRIIQYEGQDAGMFELWQRDEAWFLSRIEVLPEFQNKGIGTAIMEGMIVDATVARKPVRLQVFKINPARRLYERLDFVVTGETETHLQMENPCLAAD